MIAEEELHARLDAIALALAGYTDMVQQWIRTSATTRVKGASPVPFAVAAASSKGSGQTPTTSAGSLLGWSVRESTGAAGATLILRDGPDSSAAEVASITLIAGESTRDWFGGRDIDGIALTNGLYLDCTSGAIAGAVYLRST